MTTRLISDLHLHPGAPQVTEGFLDWLDKDARSSDTLYILGDLFDAWIGDDLLDLGEADPSGHARLAARVAKALSHLAEAGTTIRLMHGNRDFLLGERFAEQAGAQLLADPSVMSQAGRPILLMHGDSLCTRDEAYQAFRTRARDPRWQQQVLAMPIPERLQLARQLREQSGEATSNKAEEIMDVTPAEVVETMREHGVDTLIHGHTHRPAVHDFEIDGLPARRLVLGDWQPGRGWEVVVEDDGEPELREIALGE